MGRDRGTDRAEQPVHHLERRCDHGDAIGAIATEPQLCPDPSIGILSVIPQDHGIGQRQDLIGPVDAACTTALVITAMSTVAPWCSLLARSIEVWASSQ